LLLSPLLAIFSLLLASYMACRRLVYGLLFDPLRKRKVCVRVGGIISVGNLVAGGSGKSPLIRHLAEVYRSFGHPVVVLSRGYGAPSGVSGLLVLGPQNVQSSTPWPVGAGIEIRVQDLSDELQELLLAADDWVDDHHAGAGLPPLILCQNPNRLSGLRHGCVWLEHSGWAGKPAIVLLDDGMQHRACPRDVDVCVWPLGECTEAPMFAMPLGIFREGFGALWMGRLAGLCDFHVLNNGTDSAAIGQLGLLGEVVGGRGSTGQEVGDQPRVAQMHSRLSWRTSSGAAADLTSLASTVECGRKIYIVTGIAAPERFVHSVSILILDVMGLIPRKQPTAAMELERLTVCHLDDHAQFDLEAVAAGLVLDDKASPYAKQLPHGSFLFLTLKDFCRWRWDPVFLDFSKETQIVVGVLQTALVWDHKGDGSTDRSPAERLLELATRRRELRQLS
jgi:hypothetical protein